MNEILLFICFAYFTSTYSLLVVTVFNLYFTPSWVEWNHETETLTQIYVGGGVDIWPNSNQDHMFRCYQPTLVTFSNLPICSLPDRYLFMCGMCLLCIGYKYIRIVKFNFLIQCGTNGIICNIKKKYLKIFSQNVYKKSEIISSLSNLHTDRPIEYTVDLNVKSSIIVYFIITLDTCK